MKRSEKLIIFGIAIIVIGMASFSVASENDLPIDHEAMASLLEEKAHSQDEIISLHTRMRDNAAGRSFGRDNIPAGTGFDIMAGEMQKHCEDIIVAAQNLKEELLEFAQWHRSNTVNLGLLPANKERTRI